MVRVERSFRGISLRLACHYLENLGGERVADRTIQGEDWRATVSESTVTVGPTLTITEVTIVFVGQSDVIETLVPRFARKAMRAGG